MQLYRIVVDVPRSSGTAKKKNLFRQTFQQPLSFLRLSNIADRVLDIFVQTKS